MVPCILLRVINHLPTRPVNGAMYGTAGNSKSLNLSMLLFTSTNKESSLLIKHKQETTYRGLKCKETELHCYHYDRIIIRILIKLSTRNHLVALFEDDLSRLKVYKRSLSCVERKPFDFKQSFYTALVECYAIFSLNINSVISYY